MNFKHNFVSDIPRPSVPPKTVLIANGPKRQGM